MENVMKHLLAILALLTTTASAFAESKSFRPDADGRIEFDTPSLNLCCTFNENVTYYPEGSGSGALLTCTRVAPKYWIVELRPDGKQIANKNPGEVPGCGYGQPIGNVLNIGDSWSKAGFDCKLARNGITCTAARGKGFRLSRSGLFRAF
jgi:hypothetical protein